MKDYILSSNFIAIRRKTKENNNSECIINFRKDCPTFLIPNKVKYVRRKMNIDIFYIYYGDQFDEVKTLEANKNKSTSTNSTKQNYTEIDSLSRFDFCQNSENVSIEGMKKWSEIELKAFVPSPVYGYDIYELEWFLEKINHDLGGVFDYDSFLIVPVYPKDILNNSIPYDIVMYYIRKYVKQYSLHKLKLNFSILYLFYRDKLGNKLLNLFYEEKETPSDNNLKIIQKLHSIYHSTSELHPYKTFLFYENFCLTSSSDRTFKIQRYILNYIQFFGSFICRDFVYQRTNTILLGIESSSKNNYFQSIFHSSESELKGQINEIHNHFGKNISWALKDHFRAINNPLSRFMLRNWYRIRRNVNLWDVKVLNFNDDQFVNGVLLSTMFPRIWVSNFHNPKYEFKVSTTTSRRQKKKKI